MSRTITLIAAIGAALTLSVPAAWGMGQPVQQDPATAAILLRSEELGRAYQDDPTLFGADSATLGRRSSTIRPYGYSALAVMKAIETREQQQTSALDAREQASAAKRNAQLTSGTPPDAFERAANASGTPPDAFERAANASGTGSSVDHFTANDNRFRVTPVNDPVTVAATGSGTDVEWPQIGIGLGIGIALMLGLALALRATRHRPLAH
jgi:hypothetical protein